MNEKPPPLDDDQQDRIADYLAGNLGASESAKLEQEILADPAKSEALYGHAQLWQLLEQLGESQETPVRRPRSGSAWRRRIATIALPIAAGIAMVLIFGPFGDSPNPVHSPTFRGPDLGVEGYSPRGPQAQAPSLFEWPASSEASSYRFELYDSNAQLVHEALVTTNRYELPESVASRGEVSIGTWKAVPLLTGSVEVGPAPMIQYRVQE